MFTLLFEDLLKMISLVRGKEDSYLKKHFQYSYCNRDWAFEKPRNLPGRKMTAKQQQVLQETITSLTFNNNSPDIIERERKEAEETKDTMKKMLTESKSHAESLASQKAVKGKRLKDKLLRSTRKDL